MAPKIAREPNSVRRMFAGIAPRYDLLNRVLSLRRDVAWRRRAAREVPTGPGTRILDLCGGTGDLALEVALRRSPGFVVCADFSPPMLARATPKFRRGGVDGRCAIVVADALRLPFRDAAFDAVTVAFGVRNLGRMDDGLAEMLRVLRPGGRLVLLEFSRPRAPVLHGLYRFYLRRILPAIGDRVAGRAGPYGYLADTISEFPDPPALAERMREAGFRNVSWSAMSGGIVALHTASRANA